MSVNVCANCKKPLQGFINEGYCLECKNIERIAETSNGVKEHSFSQCITENCVNKFKCYRYVAEPTPKQSSYDVQPTRNFVNDFHCDYFIQLPTTKLVP